MRDSQVQQIAIGGASKKELGGLWHELLGITKLGEHTASVDNVAQDILSVGPRPFNVEIDLMQPLDAAARPNPASHPLHHVGLWVDNLPGAVDYLKAKGVGFVGDVRRGAAPGGDQTSRRLEDVLSESGLPGGVGARAGAANCDVAFIDPKAGGQGVLIELVQAPAAVRVALAEVEALAGKDSRGARPPPSGPRPTLRFAEGQRVSARVGEETWEDGTVVGLWHRCRVEIPPAASTRPPRAADAVPSQVQRGRLAAARNRALQDNARQRPGHLCAAG